MNFGQTRSYGESRKGTGASNIIRGCPPSTPCKGRHGMALSAFRFHTFKVADDVAIPLIVSKLPPKDFMWIRHHLKTAHVKTWDELTAVFRNLYNLDDEVETKENMYGASQRSGESCADIALQKLELFQQCSYPEAEAQK